MSKIQKANDLIAEMVAEKIMLVCECGCVWESNAYEVWTLAADPCCPDCCSIDNWRRMDEDEDENEDNYLTEDDYDQFLRDM